MFPSRRAALGGDVFRDEYSLEFDGTNDYVDMAAAPLSGISDYPFTVAGWFNSTFDSGDSHIFAINDESSSSVKYILLSRAEDGQGNLRLYVADGSATSSTNTLPDDGNEFNDNNWHHFAAVFTNNTSRTLYIDGVNRTDDPDTTDIDYITDVDSFVLGVDNDNSPSKRFKGKISDIALYSSALSASQVATIYNGREPYNHKEGVASGSLEGWWRMGDGTERGAGTTVYDMSANANNGTMTNFPAGAFNGDTP